ncbi:esterase/lipase family protein [Microbulbifer sp. TYP-18]|uniref:esterase/lipase family protein n=1 Tax=Microbulbifer sp. TYP-18 TaxID=3230024 RepID=UPI0034C6D67C
MPSREWRQIVMAIVLWGAAIQAPTALAGTQCVILLHGLTKDSSSLEPLQQRLIASGYYVANMDYPSREKPIQELASLAVEAGLNRCARAQAQPVNFVTHSMGGLLVRYFYEHQQIPAPHRVVMLAPPNQGSRIGDWLDHIPWIKQVNGPAGRQMGTGKTSVPLQLSPVSFDLGIIAGNRSRNPIASAILRGADDGRITVESAKVKGMCAFMTLPLSHGNIMANDTAMEEVLRFLRYGYFTGESALLLDCPARHH